MNKTIRINISKNGFFLGNERLNMLEYQFNEIRLRNHFYIVESDTSPGANCVIYYDFKPEKTAFFSELDVWFTRDNKSLSENDYKKLAAFYDDYNPVLTEGATDTSSVLTSIFVILIFLTLTGTFQHQL